MALSQKRSKKLSAPASELELREYAEACRLVKLEPADTLRKLASGFAEHVRKHGEFVVPVRFVGRK